MCKDVSCITYNNQTNFSRCSFSFLLLTLSWQRIVKVKWRVINNMYVVRRLDD